MKALKPDSIKLGYLKDGIESLEESMRINVKVGLHSPLGSNIRFKMLAPGGNHTPRDLDTSRGFIPLDWKERDLAGDSIGERFESALAH